jgi:hypothetical protein
LSPDAETTFGDSTTGDGGWEVSRQAVRSVKAHQLTGNKRTQSKTTTPHNHEKTTIKIIGDQLCLRLSADPGRLRATAATSPGSGHPRAGGFQARTGPRASAKTGTGHEGGLR